MLLFALLGLVAAAVLAIAVVARLRRGPEAVPVPEAPEQPRRELVLAEAVPAPARLSGAVEPPSRPAPLVLLPPQPKTPELALDALDALLEELESATVRIDGADELDERSVAELEGLAARLEAAAASFAPG
ncbi:MAG: hypothetical protein QOK22_1293 [Gaiellaceae bacterium]|jgi:hypothetical protein|nr:hypothetical protein [Gaiellaceae bacterium]